NTASAHPSGAPIEPDGPPTEQPPDVDLVRFADAPGEGGGEGGRCVSPLGARGMGLSAPMGGVLGTGVSVLWVGLLGLIPASCVGAAGGTAGRGIPLRSCASCCISCHQGEADGVNVPVVVYLCALPSRHRLKRR